MKMRSHLEGSAGSWYTGVSNDNIYMWMLICSNGTIRWYSFYFPVVWTLCWHSLGSRDYLSVVVPQVLSSPGEEPQGGRCHPFQDICPERSPRNSLTEAVMETLHLWQVQWVLERSPLRAGHSTPDSASSDVHTWQLSPGYKLAQENWDKTGSSIHNLNGYKSLLLVRNNWSSLFRVTPLKETMIRGDFLHLPRKRLG